MRPLLLGLISLALFFSGCNDDNDGPSASLQLISLRIDNQDLIDSVAENVNVNASIAASFSESLDTATFIRAFSILDSEANSLNFRANFFNENKGVTIYAEDPFEFYALHQVRINDELRSQGGGKLNEEVNASFRTEKGSLQLESIMAGRIDLTGNGRILDVSPNLEITATFSGTLDPENLTTDDVILTSRTGPVDINLTLDGNTLLIESEEPIDYLREHELTLKNTIEGIDATGFEGFETSFTTALDSSYKFPEITDEELLTLIQQQTFKYFWDFGHPVSGLARERNTSGETVTSGGSGFGVMAILVAIERGFITREEGVERLLKIVNFLWSQADRFHGAWSHWLDGTTGEVRPFSADDDGGDLVETAFMIQGLLTVRQYMNADDPTENEIIYKINEVWEDVEWDWYTQGGQNALFWHWSPNFEWQKNHQISGWNEALIVYVLAASSPSHTIDPKVYEYGWARSGLMRNGDDYYDIELPLGPNRGGPLFFSHYSFLGLDPRNLVDNYANYWEQNVHHSLINFEYCKDNPRNYVGYSESCWGLTASDGNQGYSAHSPNNDRGVVTPTAAVSSLPYTPEESLRAIRHFYYLMGDRLWGEYGFYDAFNISEDWYASSYIAIDQGPIICMIENYRTGLLWDLFMSAPEVQDGLTKLGFTY